MARGRWGTPTVSELDRMQEAVRQSNIHMDRIKKGAWVYQCKVCMRVLFHDEIMADGGRHRLYHKGCGFGESSEAFLVEASEEFDTKLRRKEPWAPLFS
jgi:hypothetical protein